MITKALETTEDPKQGTSFHDQVIITTVNYLEKQFGKAQSECNDGSDKVNFEWRLQTSDGDIFYLYDWKHYKPLSKNKSVEFNIGAETPEIGLKAQKELLKM